MAPDLNSVPPSPRPAATSTSTAAPQQSSQQSSTTASRRASQIFPMSPPPLPLASPSSTIPASTQHGHPFPPLSPSLTGPVPSVDASGVPMRHPRPLTAAELHLELEKEQEAVVNRLTRELSNLRAHSASVASTASSTSNNPGLFDTSDPATTHGPTHPTASRRHRSSSSVSRTSQGIPLNTATVGIPHHHQHRYSGGGSVSTRGGGESERDVRSASIVSTPRYEEVAHYKLELEDAKRENDMLRRRIRELEGLVRERRGSASGSEVGRRGRSGGAERLAPEGEAAVSNGEAGAGAGSGTSTPAGR